MRRRTRRVVMGGHLWSGVVTARLQRVTALVTTCALLGGGLPLVLGSPASAAPVGQGFTITASDLSFILQQIRVSEAHVRNTTTETGPCGALLGTGPDQVASPLVAFGVRTVDGSCNNLQPGQETFGAASELFPRLTTPVWRQADWGTDYTQNDVADADPRIISNLIVDQTSANPAAVQAAGFPVRTQGDDGFVPCGANGLPVGCVPEGETLPILNVTTDIGLSPPSNGLFVLFGQFFDHGIDKITNGGSGTVFVPLQADDPLYVPGGRTNFMVLTRGTDMNGAADGREALNTDTPWVDLSQAYASHPSHQVFLREYVATANGPDSTGRLLAMDGGLPNWNLIKQQAAGMLGLQLVDMDVHDIPIVWADAYGNYVPGPHGYAQWMTADGPVEGDPAAPVAAPGNVLRTGIAFLNDISHPAAPDPGETPDGGWTPGPDGQLANVPDVAGGPADEATDDVVTTSTTCTDPGDLLNDDAANQCGDDPDPVDIDESADDVQVTEPTCIDPMVPNPASADGCGDDPDTIDVDESLDDITGLQTVCRPGALRNNASADGCGDDPTPVDIDEAADDTTTTVTTCTSPGQRTNPTTADQCGDDPATTHDETLDNVFVNDGVAGSPAARPAPGTYDDELLGLHFIAGDGRLNENIGLTAIHQVFHNEHDRVAADIESILAANPDLAAAYAATDAGTFSYGERIFQAARFVTEMEYQHLVFEEFARKIQPAINPFDVFAFGSTDVNPAISAEYAHAVYRFGHSQLREDIERVTNDGVSYDIALLDGFLNPAEYTRGPGGATLSPAEAAGNIIMGMSEQTSSEIDEFVTDTLRNNLVGLPLDLAALNLARGRSEGVPSLNEFRRQIHAATNDAAMVPYVSWTDFGLALRTPASLVNFVAAYGRHPSITAQTTNAGRREAARLLVDPHPERGDVIPADAADFMEGVGSWGGRETGLNDVDLWVGGLAENTTPFGGLLGPTFNYVFEKQLTELQNGDRFYYLQRTPGMNLRSQLEGNSFAEMIERNTTAHSLKADAFATSDCKFQLAGSPGIANRAAPWNGTTVQNDPTTECDEQALLIRRTSDNQIRYRPVNGVDPSGINGQSVYNGTPGTDNVYGGNDNDTLLGNEGDDILEGGGGADFSIGGEGDDRITDFAGDDVLKGGPGNDALDAGPGLDILMGGDGSDVTNGGDNINDHFLGNGNDFTLGGGGGDVVYGDSGDDWIQGGAQQDLLIGDSSTFFFTDFNLPGNDVFLGQGGDDDYDGEGGDDVFLGDPGLEKNSGAAGFDWFTGIQDPQAGDEDLAQVIVAQGQVGVETRSRFFEVEGLSGGDLGDVLKGDEVIPVQNAGGGAGGFIGCDALDADGIARVPGLEQLVTPAMRTVDAAVVQAAATTNHCLLEGTVWGAGNIILGGRGSDQLQGRGGDDILDGDRYLDVRLSVRTDVTDPATELGWTTRLELPAAAGTFGPGTAGMTLQQAVFAGLVDPGHIAIEREIIVPDVPAADCAAAAPANCDVAVFAFPMIEYAISGADGVLTVEHIPPPNGGGGGGGGGGVDPVGGEAEVVRPKPENTDTLRNVERLQFADVVLDLVAPGAPTNVRATALSRSATVTWAASPTSVPTISSYTLFATDVTDPDNPVALAPVTNLPSQVLITTVPGLLPSHQYLFELQANNALGSSSRSVPSNTVVPGSLPGAPAAVAVAPLGGGLDVAWTAPADQGSPALTSYSVRVYNATTNALVRLRTATAPSTTYTMTGLPTGTYTVGVTATNQWGVGPESARTAPVVVTAPLLLAPTTPVAGSTTASPVANIVATFDQPVTGVVTGAASTNVILEQADTGVRFNANVTFNATARTVTIDPTGTLANDTLYRVRVLAGSCVTVSGIRIASPCVAFGGSSWTFRTALNTAPTVVSSVPVSGAVGAGRDNDVVITMSEPVRNASAATVRLTSVSTGAVVSARVSVTAAGVIRLNPNVRLARETVYRVDIGTSANGLVAITDVQGLDMSPTSWTFTTGR